MLPPLLLVTLVSAASLSQLDRVVDLTVALQRHYSSDCVFLVYDVISPQLILLGLRVVTLTSGEWTVEDTSYLIGHLSFRLYPECIMILYGDTDISSVKRTADIVKLEKFLWRRTSKMVGVMHYRDYGQTTTGCLSRPMFVLLSAGITEEEFLLEVLQLGTTKMVTGFVGFVGQPVKTPRTPIWLILTNATIPDEFFYGMYPAMSSEVVIAQRNTSDGCIELKEVYRVQEEAPLTMIKLGTWNRETGLSWTDKTLIERRSDLQGAVIPALTRDSPPFTAVQYEEDGGIRVGGFAGLIWAILEQHLNFKSEYTVDDTEAGNYEPILRLDSPEHVLVAVSVMTRVSERDAPDVDELDGSTASEDVFDYSDPILYSSSRAYIRHPGFVGAEWLAYISPLTPQLWMALTVTAVLLATLLTITCKLSGRAGFDSDQHFSMGDSLLCIVGVLSAQGYETSPVSYSSRIVYLLALLISVVAAAGYSGALISSITVRHFDMPFSDLESLQKDGSYTLGAVSGSYEWSYLVYSKDPTLRNLSAKMYDDMRENSHSFREAAARTCGTNFAFVVNEDHLMSLSDQMPCNVIPIPSFSFKTSLVFTLAKNNPYRRFINRSLRQLTTSGILKKLLRDSRATELSGPDNIITTVQLSSVIFLYSVLCAGMVCSFILLILEMIYAEAKVYSAEMKIII